MVFVTPAVAQSSRAQISTNITTCGIDQVPQIANGTKLPFKEGMEAPSTIIALDSWSHDLWNQRNLSGFLGFFTPTIDYVDHASGQVVKTPAEMRLFASNPWNYSSDLKLYNRTYTEDPASKAVWVEATLCGTNDKSVNGQPATGKKFKFDAAEVIYWTDTTNPPAKGTGGGIYYDTATVLKQVGLVNATAMNGTGS